MEGETRANQTMLTKQKRIDHHAVIGSTPTRLSHCIEFSVSARALPPSYFPHIVHPSAPTTPDTPPSASRIRHTCLS